jgi:glycosyltransferase involved in cell wall biosynthesis
MVKHAAVYDPYLDTFGGGERYCLTVAEILLMAGWKVDLFWSGDSSLVKTAETRFSLVLNGLNLVPDIFGLVPQNLDLIEGQIPQDRLISHRTPRTSIFKKFLSLNYKYRVLRHYDVLFYLSDGSLPYLFAKKNLFHIQVPFVKNTSRSSFLNNILKKRLIHRIICNSEFTASFIESDLKSKTSVISPPVSIDSFTVSPQKQNQILSVGRFDNVLNLKRQDLLIEVFTSFFRQNPQTNWKLILAGSSQSDPGQNHYLLHLRNLAQNLPIEFCVNPDFQTLKDIYSKSILYWHAAGYGINEQDNPEKTEHFGISPVEAMASGCVPLLVRKGGLKEIITDSIDGYFWDTPQDLLAKTQLLINTRPDLQNLSLAAQKSAKRFSKEIFSQKLLEIINQP